MKRFFAKFSQYTEMYNSFLLLGFVKNTHIQFITGNRSTLSFSSHIFYQKYFFSVKNDNMFLIIMNHSHLVQPTPIPTTEDVAKSVTRIYASNEYRLPPTSRSM